MVDISLGTFGSVFTRLLTKGPAFLLRRKYNKAWLASRIKIDLRPRNEPVRINGGELPEITIWLSITNHGYFLVELDRLNLDFRYASLNVRATHIKKIEIPPHTTVELFLRSPLTTEQAVHISKNTDRPYVAAQVTAEFNCEIHGFSVDTGELSGISPSLLNMQNS